MAFDDEIPEALALKVRANAEDLTPAQASELAARVGEHVAELKGHGAVDDDLADELGDVLLELLRHVGEEHGVDEQHRRLIRGGVVYFLDRDDLHADAGPGGLGDDTAVVTAICGAVGRTDLKERLEAVITR